ncbi:aminoglycoside phosphotransferase [Spirochaetia bacterium]|nr:aminoglycoside phosphotransferase [Spirochaetia bacterium]
MELIASGDQADVYKNENIAIKLFKRNISKDDIAYEMNLQKMVFALGLPVPAIYDMVEIDGKIGFSMELVDGVPLDQIALKDENELQKYIVKSIEIQLSLSKNVVNNFPLMKKILQKNINNANMLGIEYKQKILEKFENINFDNYLCHGDFHLMNLLKTNNGIKIIDWVNSSSGNSEADICRTYLLYKNYNKELAELYLKNYCEIANVPKDNILYWLSINAAARLSEGMGTEENNFLMEIIKKSI